MKTVINSIDGSWKAVKNKCRTTIGKEYTNKEPSKEFIQKLLISEHSPIRTIHIDWTWKDIEYWASTQWSRHKWECFIRSQRTDRTGVDRNNLSQSELVNMDGYANPQNLIDSMRKRLCFQASEETRDLAGDLKYVLLTKEMPPLGFVLVPNCIYRCGCPEFEQCPFFGEFLKEFNGGENGNIADIASRYKVYNKMFLDGGKSRG